MPKKSHFEKLASKNFQFFKRKDLTNAKNFYISKLKAESVFYLREVLMSRQKTPYAGLKPKDVKDATWRAVVEAWENGLSDREAAFRASKYGDYTTVADIKGWIKDNPEIGELKAMLESDLRSSAKIVVADAIREGDSKTAKWYLERKAADEFSTKASIEFENAVVALTLDEKADALKQFVEDFESNDK